MSDFGGEQGPQKQVCFLGADTRLRQKLTAQIAPKSIMVTGFDDPAGLVDACAHRAPDAIVLDLASLPPEQGLAQFLAALIPASGEPPALICIGEGKGIEWRLEAIRCGVDACFPSPVSADALARKVLDLLESDHDQKRVLIVEDDANQSRVFARVIANAGIGVQVVSEPLLLLEGIETFHPDLILMDLYMPSASGAELTRIIRDHDVYGDIPILFLSAEDDPDKQLEAMRLGADGFIVKPVRRKALIGAIEHRIWMHRRLKERWSTQRRRREESGLVQKRAFLVQVDRLVRAAQSSEEGWAVMVVDIDDPQHLLQHLGLSGTERLVQDLGPLIAGHLETNETTTRIGDFRYALLARRGDLASLRGLGERIVASIHDTPLDTEVRLARPTVSIGIGPFSPPANDASTLISRGHKAALLAHRAGGNRIACWESDANPDEVEADLVILPLVDGALAGGRGGFQIYFQPLLSLRQTHDELFETLLRLRTPDSELIPPMEFLKVADRHGKAESVDRWVLSQSLDLLQTHRERRHPLRLLVHQRLETVLSTSWLEWVRAQIVERDMIHLRPRLVLQADELVQRLEQTRALTPALMQLGIEACAANVTGGEKQLAMLDALAIRLVKVPLNRLASLGSEKLSALVGHLREQGVAVVASGIEDADTLAMAWSVRPDYVQGNYLQMPSAELALELDQETG